MNECAEGLSTCDPFRSNCSNSKGSFNCFCKPGYEADENGECKGLFQKMNSNLYLKISACLN